MKSHIRPGELPYRSATLSDAEQLGTLDAACFPNPWKASAWHSILAEPTHFVLASTEGQHLVAFACFFELPGELELLRLAVASDRRRRGLGRVLVEAGLARLEGQKPGVCHLEVRASDEGAIAFYEDLGFRASGKRSRYYPDGTDALLMAWRSPSQLAP